MCASLPNFIKIGQTVTAGRSRDVNQTRRRRRRWLSLLTTVDESWLFHVYKSVNCRPNPLTLLLRFVVDLLYNLFLQLTRF